MSEFVIQTLSVVFLLSGMAVILLVMWLMLWHRDRTVRLPIDRDKLQRIPALGLQNQIQDLLFEILSAFMIAVMVVCLPFAVAGIHQHIVSGSIPWLFLLGSVLGVIYAAFKMWKSFGKLIKLRLGHAAELATANELIGLQAFGYQIFHDVQADGFNIDHLVIGMNGVFVIETKGRHKRNKDKKNGVKDHEVTFKEGKLLFPSWVETKPLDQAVRQAKWVGDWLSKACGLDVSPMPILVFPGWFIKRDSKPPFPILSHRQLIKTIPNCRSQLFTYEQIGQIAFQVGQKSMMSKI
ncbi:NERD domain-containing protein [Shewanella sp. A25]|nr:NERD domain-containing protein [Shewanella shenzhenensis]